MNSAGSETASPEEAVQLEEVPVEEFREEEDGKIQAQVNYIEMMKHKLL